MVRNGKERENPNISSAAATFEKANTYVLPVVHFAMRRPGVRIPAAPPIESTTYGEALLAVFASVGNAEARGSGPVGSINRINKLRRGTSRPFCFRCQKFRNQPQRQEEVRGCRVESVESDTRGFDLISRRLASEVSRGSTETRFIEVKGRAAVGEIALTANEYKTAQRLGEDYWLYVVFNCASAPEVTTIQNPARFDWEPLSKIDCYRIGADMILRAH